MSLYKCLRTFAVDNRNHVFFFCADEKHLVNVGEPNEPVAALDTNKRVMVHKEQEVGASDHDYKRFKICPSVILKSDTPETMEGTFYHGEVFVAVKDAVLQKSTPLRHAVEKQKCVTGLEWCEIECNYSDGGPDHNTDHYSVKIGHACHFLRMDLDMLVAAVTYPGGSYVDPAERMMPSLTMAMNGVALSREKMSDEDEKTIKNCNTMESLRQLCESDPELETNLKASVGCCVALLKERFARVSLKDVLIQIRETATKEDEDILFDEIKIVDSSLKITNTTKVQVQKCKDLMDFLKIHAVEHRYIFQLKKCKVLQ